MSSHARSVCDVFARRHGYAPKVYYAPGRVNLLGAHVDYNGGTVLPLAIDRGTWLAIGAPVTVRSKGRRYQIASLDLDSSVSLTSDSSLDLDHAWAAYVYGMLKAAEARGLPLESCDIVVSGNLPRGSGLSSSASLELVTGVALASTFEWDLDLLQLADMAWEVETRFVGVSCGIMDQYAVALGKHGHALSLDCRTRVWRHVAFPATVELLVLDTKRARQLVDSAYNERVRECAEALEILGKDPAIAWGDVTVDDLASSSLSPLLMRRARHVVTEIARVQSALAALELRDMEALGALMTACHASCAQNYEVSCAELDWLVHAVCAVPGVYGARMMGAGFGGCAVALCDAGSVDDDARRILESRYREHFGHSPELHRVRVGGGPKRVGPSDFS